MAFVTYGMNTSERVAATNKAMLDLIKDVDQLLGADANFLLGHWIAMAADCANSPDEVCFRP